MKMHGPKNKKKKKKKKVVIFFMDDVTFIRDVEVCVGRMICYIPEFIWYGSENFVLGSLHDDCVGLAGATTQIFYVAPYRFDYSFVDE